MNIRLMCIPQRPVTVTLKSGETITGHCNYHNADGIELIVGADFRWIKHADRVGAIQSQPKGA